METILEEVHVVVTDNYGANPVDDLAYQWVNLRSGTNDFETAQLYRMDLSGNTYDVFTIGYDGILMTGDGIGHFGWTTIPYYNQYAYLEGDPITHSIRIVGCYPTFQKYTADVIFGAGGTQQDIDFLFDSESNDGNFSWMEDENYFQFNR